jgi:hypothetical protein
MNVTIHVGMHKTGSSSIQSTLFNFKSSDFSYLPWNIPNHSNLFALLFYEPVEEYFQFKAKGLCRKSLLAMRKENLSTLASYLALHHNDHVVMSAEIISGERYRQATEGLKRFFDQYSDVIRVVAYVRPPISFMQSNLQQLLKGNYRKFDYLSLWPNYKRRFDKLDHIFGRANVTLRPYSKSTLYDGDVVADFCRLTCISVPQQRFIRSNDSLSLEALSLLYVFRKMSDEPPFSGRPAALIENNLFIRALSSVGRRKFSFSKRIINEVVNKYGSDLIWMEKRLGCSLLDRPSSQFVVDSEADFFRVACELEDDLDALCSECLSGVHAEHQDAIRLKLSKLKVYVKCLRKAKLTQ